MKKTIILRIFAQMAHSPIRPAVFIGQRPKKGIA